MTHGHALAAVSVLKPCDNVVKVIVPPDIWPSVLQGVSHNEGRCNVAAEVGKYPPPRRVSILHELLNLHIDSVRGFPKNLPTHFLYFLMGNAYVRSDLRSRGTVILRYRVVKPGRDLFRDSLFELAPRPAYLAPASILELSSDQRQPFASEFIRTHGSSPSSTAGNSQWLTYGTSPLYGPPLVRKFRLCEQQTSRSQDHHAASRRTLA